MPYTRAIFVPQNRKRREVKTQPLYILYIEKILRVILVERRSESLLEIKLWRCKKSCGYFVGP